MHFWGMHLFWWFFWVLIIIGFFGLMEPMPRSRARVLRTRSDTPLEILQRRYAAGELTTPEYEERKAALERDANVAMK